MKIHHWNKLNDKEKEVLKRQKVILVAGPIDITRKRIVEIINLYKSEENVLFGCLESRYIDGFEDSLQFKSLTLERLARVKEVKKVMCYFQKDLKYIIRELKPKVIIFVNGSWQGQIHYRKDYWEAVGIKSEIKLISPFSSEKEAINYSIKIQRQYDSSKLFKNSHKYSDAEIFQILEKKRKESWDWIGQPTAALVKNGEILALAHNRVVPYESYQMHFGSLRELMQTPAQEMMETQMTNHAETELMEIARRLSIKLQGVALYASIFPCPICAKMISRTPIKRIVYSQDHNLGNTFGYKVLEKSGVKLKRVVL